MTEAAVEIEQLSKQFPGNDSPALNNISARIIPGQMTGLVGPDAAGKTTLIRLICGLMIPSQGHIKALGFDTVKDAEKIHQRIGYMPQKFGLYEDLSVIENLNLYAELRSIPGEKREKSFKRLLKFTQLEPFQSRLAGKLSGGMKQKLGLACALLGEPQLLVLDEPSVGVDPISRRELWQMVQELLHGGIAVIWSTSYLDEAEKCDQVILLNDGKQLFEGAPNQLLAQVQGRCWHVCNVAMSERRRLLMKLLRKKEVIDGVIQGENIRIVLKKDADKPRLEGLSPEQWKAVSPQFEDAFIDRLGGGPGGYSRLAEEIPEKPKVNFPVIESIDLTKRFGDFTAVSHNNYQIRQGEIFGLLGPNGAGKSTTFKMMCGLLQPTEGKATVMRLDLKHSSSMARSKIGYMAQKFSLYGELNARQNLSFFSGLYGLKGALQNERIEEMINIFELEKILKQNAGNLPLGYKQRLALACAVMHQPDILFLDEPTSGVDPVTRREFWTHINGMVNKGVTVMVTTHFMDEAEYCDRIALIYRGENIALGTPDALKNQVKSPAMPDPSLEDAFIELIREHDAKAGETPS